MHANSRAATYRRRRLRAAARRRAWPRRRPASCLNGPNPSLPPPSAAGREGRLRRALLGLRRRLDNYPGVAGVLFRRHGSQIFLHVVAPPPMTATMGVLTSTWVDELRGAFPGFRWDCRVTRAAPDTPCGYECLFWREG